MSPFCRVICGTLYHQWVKSERSSCGPDLLFWVGNIEASLSRKETEGKLNSLSYKNILWNISFHLLQFPVSQMLISYRGLQPPERSMFHWTKQHIRRWVVGEWVKHRLCSRLLPIAHMTAWALPPVRSATALDTHRSVNTALNCAYEGSRLHAPDEDHPENIPIPTPSRQKFSSMKPVPGAKMFGECWSNTSIK